MAQGYVLSNHPLAQIYISRALDPVVNVTHALSEDFFKRTHHYQGISDDIAGLLTDFRSFIGNHPEWPDSSQRILTASRVLSRFSQNLANIRRIAIAFTERTSSPGEPVVRHSFMEEAALLRATAQPLEGVGLSMAERHNSGMLERAMTV